MIFLKFHDDDGPTLVNLSHVTYISEDVGILNITTVDGHTFRAPGSMASLERALHSAAPVTILEL